MKEINISKMITTKRKEKGLTQEQLAEFLGVTKASVSKWETAQSYPDLSLLPLIASYFNISIDSLIGYSPQLTREEIKKIYHKLAEDFSHKPFEDVLTECRQIIKKYYACFPLLLQMTKLIINHFMLVKEKEHQDSILKEAINLCLRIKKESDDVWLAKQANAAEAVCYLFLNQPENALKLLDTTMKPSISEHFLLSNSYQMMGNIEKAKEALQVSLYQHLRGLLAPAQTYLVLIATQPQLFEEALERFIQIVKIFKVEKLDPNLVCLLYLAAAHGYMIQSNKEKSLEMLEKYIAICITFLLPYSLKGDAFFDSIEEWLKDYDFEPPRDEKTVKESILQSVIENPAFIPLHDDWQFKRLVEKLKAHF